MLLVYNHSGASLSCENVFSACEDRRGMVTLFKGSAEVDAKHIHRDARSTHFLHLLFVRQSYGICFILQWLFQKLFFVLLVLIFSKPSCLCMLFTCAAVLTLIHLPLPPSSSPSLSSQSHVHLILLMSPPRR